MNLVRKQKTFLGIDPGLDGGLVLNNEAGEILERHVMPVIESKKMKRVKDKKTGEMKDSESKNRSIDTVALNRLFIDLKPKVSHVIFEQVASRPGMGAPAVFKFGKVFGFIEGLIVGHQLAYTLVVPAVWCKVIHQGLPGDEPKARSRIALGRLFPTADLRTTLESGNPSKNPHEGLMDGLLLAEWGRRKALVGEL
jgi:hypothetical protein